VLVFLHLVYQQGTQDAGTLDYVVMWEADRLSIMTVEPAPIQAGRNTTEIRESAHPANQLLALVTYVLCVLTAVNCPRYRSSIVLPAPRR
jgi:hypothetical protein